MLARPEHLPSRQGARARIIASACASDNARLGDRAERYRFAAKTAAAQLAYRQAGIAEPATAIDVAEIYDAFTGAEIQAIEALDLCCEGQGGAAIAAGEHGAGGPLPVNLSGGLIGQGSAPGATGVAQLVTIARLLGGTYFADLQPASSPRRGLADTHGGVAAVCAVHILQREEE